MEFFNNSILIEMRFALMNFLGKRQSGYAGEEFIETFGLRPVIL
ncbi:hypothetical protein [Leptospira weilii]|nr:hypothetical protein [Leptospira weilii]